MLRRDERTPEDTSTSPLWARIILESYSLLDEKLKINGDLFGSLLAYSYLCSVKTYVLTTPLSAGSTRTSTTWRATSYELTIVTVGVAYGTEIHRVREVLVEAMKKVRTKDQYGREIVDPAYGINVVVGKMNDSAVDVNVKQYVLVAERIGYVDRAKEVIYDALTAAGITIPFPQCDVHLIHEE